MQEKERVEFVVVKLDELLVFSLFLGFLFCQITRVQSALLHYLPIPSKEHFGSMPHIANPNPIPNLHHKPPLLHLTPININLQHLLLTNIKIQ